MIPSGPIGDKVLRAAIVRYVEAVIDGQEHRYAAVTGILRRDYPAFRVRLASATARTRSPERSTRSSGWTISHLLIQGPPGSRQDLYRFPRDRSPARPRQTCRRVFAFAQGDQLSAPGGRDRCDQSGGSVSVVSRNRLVEEQFLNGSIIEDTTDNDYASGSGHDLIAGTAWLFARPELDQQLDYLFIDEAGRSRSPTRSRWAYAPGTWCWSAIRCSFRSRYREAIRGDPVFPRSNICSTVPRPFRQSAGIFLSKTRRMHPDLCRFVSDSFYDGRLMAEAGNERQGLILNPDADPALAPTGLRFISVEHEGCSQKSEAEANRVRQLYQSLLAQRWIDRKGRVRPIGVDDILVVSPYNMQVNLLRSRLPEGARVGTVDKFQGQEAAVVLISMATSSGDDLPRQIEFLYSRNRLNVAISRARCLAVIVASPKLLETSCSTIEQLRLVNALCWAKNFADGRPSQCVEPEVSSVDEFRLSYDPSFEKQKRGGCLTSRSTPGAAPETWRSSATAFLLSGYVSRADGGR